jgi:hypothetical protein
MGWRRLLAAGEMREREEEREEGGLALVHERWRLDRLQTGRAVASRLQLTPIAAEEGRDST